MLRADIDSVRKASYSKANCMGNFLENGPVTVCELCQGLTKIIASLQSSITGPTFPSQRSRSR